MLALVIRRTASLILTAWAATALVFLALDQLPGDPALVVLGTEARPDTLAALRTELGLDRPAHERYLAFVGGLVTGDLGHSLIDGRPVAELVRDRLLVTGPLALASLMLAVVLAVPAGLAAAARRGQVTDTVISTLAQFGVAVPSFWLAILLVLGFAVGLGWLPAGGFPGWENGFLPALRSLVLPALALAVPEAAILARTTRRAALDTLAEDYVRTARAKGVGRTALLWRHVLPNAIIPIATVLGLQFAFLIAGALVAENVFHLPGLGRLLHQAIGQRDLVVVRSVAVSLALGVAAVSFAVDLAVALFDPRPKADA